MELKKIDINLNEYPSDFEYYLKDNEIYDSSSSPNAKVIFINKDNGYFIKKSAKDTLNKEFLMTNYFHKLGLTCEVLSYIQTNRFDFLLTPKIQGNDCIYYKYLDNPTKLCDTIVENLVKLHSINPIDCPIKNHTENYLKTAYQNFESGNYDKNQFPDSFGYKSANDAILAIEKNKHLLKNDTLLHGDYCLPNIILDDWKFSGFIDLDSGGIGDKHVDIFWGIWTLYYNLKTDKYTSRFIDAYDKDKINPDILRLISTIECFG